MTSEYNIPKHKVAVAESKTMWPGAGECVGRRGEYFKGDAIYYVQKINYL